MYQGLLQTIQFAFIFVFALFSGCTKHHQVSLNPSLPIHNSVMGNNIPIALYVNDARSSNIISKWQGDFKIRKFSVTSQGDVKDIFSAKIQQGLKKLGFLPRVHKRNPDHSLKVDILSIKSMYQENILKMDIRVKTSLHASCYNKGKQYSKTFTSRKSRKGITPATFPNENLLNASLSELLGNMFKDQALLSCLAEK